MSQSESQRAILGFLKRNLKKPVEFSTDSTEEAQMQANQMQQKTKVGLIR